MKLEAVSAEVRVLLVDIRVATVAQLLAVEVAKFAMASMVSCWYSWDVSSSCRILAEWSSALVVVLWDSCHSLCAVVKKVLKAVQVFC